MKVTLIRFTPEPDKLCGEAAAIRRNMEINKGRPWKHEKSDE